jgi:Fe-S-cluster containining protein
MTQVFALINTFLIVSTILIPEDNPFSMVFKKSDARQLTIEWMMQLTHEFFDTAINKSPAFLDRLREIFGAMDRAYNVAAQYYQFYCSGCTDSCCLTQFYHHTFLEYLYLLTGYQAAAKEKQNVIKNRAATICRETAAADRQAIRLQHMCPLNFDGLCSLYAYRPMICRMHGLAHELHRPGKAVTYAPGCHVFTKQCGQKEYHPFDRTPFYIELAKLENEFKQAAGIEAKIKMTIAEIVCTFGPQSKIV